MSIRQSSIDADADERVIVPSGHGSVDELLGFGAYWSRGAGVWSDCPESGAKNPGSVSKQDVCPDEG